WLSEQQFLNALSFCMLLPGPEAMQLATYAGWRLHGTLGGLIAGLLFVLPGAAVIMLLATIYSIYGDVPLVEALFYGIKAAVLVIVVEALLRVAKKALSQRAHWLIAALAFIGIFFLSIPYPLIVLMAGLFGWFMGTVDMDRKAVDMAHVSVGKTSLTIITWLAIWLLPLLALGWLGAPGILVEVGRFFSMLAVVTFGGAYAVLAYMAQDVVVQFGWLTAGEMVDALGLAETTPGPLILVTQFVGFLAGFKDGGLLLGLSAAVVALWVTFAPCFLWIFVSAPYIEWISNQPRLRGALKAITAAVVGVILNLSIWFALHVLFSGVNRQKLGPITLWRPDLATIEWLAVALFFLSAFLAFRLHWGIIRILLVASLLGAGLRLF
uniref:chromate efflux transporter n=1 Tax=Roseobacter litoralis TaxID=42443 RepID=UPI002494AC19